MKACLVVLTWLWIAAQPSAASVTFSKLSAVDYERARKVAGKTTPIVTQPLKKIRGAFAIPTTQGQQVFRDFIIGAAQIKQGHSEEEHTSYTYGGYLPRFRRHVVKVTYYETSQWWLVAENGRRLTLWGPPVYAPDQNRVATICPGLEYSGGQPNALQLFQLKEGVLQKVWEMQPTSWEPEEIFWTSLTTLYLKREWYSGTASGFSYWKLTIT
ncbi:MAG TPA: hypothetical protein VK364_09060 [Hymenobacter sp.]|nr:hypothetical protein [Hymenobacter sp.]